MKNMNMIYSNTGVPIAIFFRYIYEQFRIRYEAKNERCYTTTTTLNSEQGSPQSPHQKLNYYGNSKTLN